MWYFLIVVFLPCVFCIVDPESSGSGESPTREWYTLYNRTAIGDNTTLTATSLEDCQYQCEQIFDCGTVDWDSNGTCEYFTGAITHVVGNNTVSSLTFIHEDFIDAGNADCAGDHAFTNRTECIANCTEDPECSYLAMNDTHCITGTTTCEHGDETLLFYIRRQETLKRFCLYESGPTTRGSLGECMSTCRYMSNCTAAAFFDGECRTANTCHSKNYPTTSFSVFTLANYTYSKTPLCNKRDGWMYTEYDKNATRVCGAGLTGTRIRPCFEGAWDHEIPGQCVLGGDFDSIQNLPTRLPSMLPADTSIFLDAMLNMDDTKTALVIHQVAASVPIGELEPYLETFTSALTSSTPISGGMLPFNTANLPANTKHIRVPLPGMATDAIALKTTSSIDVPFTLDMKLKDTGLANTDNIVSRGVRKITYGESNKANITSERGDITMTRTYEYEATCKWWDVDAWNSSGCTTNVLANGTVQCTCDHMTFFVVETDVIWMHEYAAIVDTEVCPPISIEASLDDAKAACVLDANCMLVDNNFTLFSKTCPYMTKTGTEVNVVYININHINNSLRIRMIDAECKNQNTNFILTDLSEDECYNYETSFWAVYNGALCVLNEMDRYCLLNDRGGHTVSLRWDTATTYSSPSDCISGEYFEDDLCFACNSGHFCDGVNEYDCGPGYYQPNFASGSCEQVLPGYYTYDNDFNTPTSVGIEQSPCPSGYFCQNGIQTACANGTFSSDGGFEACTNCTADCTFPYEETATCNATMDRVCMETTCESGTFYDGGNATSCTNCSEACVFPYEETAACNATMDIVCTEIVCENGTFYDGGEATSCTNCTAACVFPNEETTACTPTTDRACTPIVCGNGTFYDGGMATECIDCIDACVFPNGETVACTPTTDRVCEQITCEDGTYASDTSCVTCTSVCQFPNHETVACTPTTNRVCGNSVCPLNGISITANTVACAVHCNSSILCEAWIESENTCRLLGGALVSCPYSGVGGSRNTSCIDTGGTRTSQNCPKWTLESGSVIMATNYTGLNVDMDEVVTASDLEITKGALFGNGLLPIPAALVITESDCVYTFTYTESVAGGRALVVFKESVTVQVGTTVPSPSTTSVGHMVSFSDGIIKVKTGNDTKGWLILESSQAIWDVNRTKSSRRTWVSTNTSDSAVNLDISTMTWSRLISSKPLFSYVNTGCSPPEHSDPSMLNLLLIILGSIGGAALVLLTMKLIAHHYGHDMSFSFHHLKDI